MQLHETRYAKSSGLNIAYQAVGEGSQDLVLADQWFSHVENQWSFPPMARLLERLASFSRLLLFDQRGIGLSDPVALTSLPSLEEWMDDLRATLDEAGSERAAIVAGMAAGLMAMVFAATYPDRVASLILVNCYARLLEAPGYAVGLPPQARELARIRAETEWGRGMMLDMFAPSLADDQSLRSKWSSYERHAASPGTAVAMLEVIWGSDIRHVLPTIRVPTLIIARGERINHGRYLATHIKDARLVELPGVDSFMCAGNQEPVLTEIEGFVTGVRPAPEPDRVLATVLFTDIVGSTEMAARLGDRTWRDLIQSHHAVVREEIEHFRGREIHTTGDGFLATFDGPARAIRCAVAIAEAVRTLGIEIRAGLHTGEIELIPDDVGGIAVHIGSRVSSAAGPREVFVSSTVKDLVAGSGIQFQDRGMHDLKGVPGQWRLFAVTST